MFQKIHPVSEGGFLCRGDIIKTVCAVCADLRSIDKNPNIHTNVDFRKIMVYTIINVNREGAKNGDRAKLYTLVGWR